MQQPPRLSAADLEGIFEPSMSVPGSSQCTTESHVYSRWLDLLQDIDGTCYPVTVTSIINLLNINLITIISVAFFKTYAAFNAINWPSEIDLSSFTSK